MAVETGFNWGAWAAMQKAAGDWTADALADNATETGDETSLDGKAACEVGLDLVEDDTGDINGVVTVFVLGHGVSWEVTDQGSPWSFTITPVRNATVSKRFSIDPAAYGSFKIAAFNEAGQELAVTIKFHTATIPAAVA